MAQWSEQEQALRLHNGGCLVIHVPSYLQGLYKAAQQQAARSGSTLEWCQTNCENGAPTTSSNPLAIDNNNIKCDFDVVVYCAGAGMFARNSNGDTVFQHHNNNNNNNKRQQTFPVQLVRGQSLELRVPPHHSSITRNALLCGKYVSPLPNSSDNNNNNNNRILVGATHEFQEQPLSRDQVVDELQKRTVPFLSASLWNDATVDRLTSGVRVQSHRGWAGRRPIVGRLDDDDDDVVGGDHGKCRKWIFTGLSSRGLLYHGVYGNLLAQAILQDSEQVLLDACPDILWWRQPQQDSD